MKTVDEIKMLLKRKAVTFSTGGKNPTNALLESWIGRVGFKLENEDIPLDNDGNKMLPLAMIFFKDLPYLPDALKGLEMISIFMSIDTFDNLGDLDVFSSKFLIRKYNILDNLVSCKFDFTEIKPFPLTPQLRENDFPVWDGGGIPDEIMDDIYELEKNEDLDYFDDICEETYSEHKVGGYPAFCQSGIDIPYDGYEFVLQISSDEKAAFNIVDSGSFFFYYNKEKNEWKVYCDFY